MYDVTAWNLTMQYDLPSWVVDEHIDDGLEKIVTASAAPAQPAVGALAYLVDGNDDHSVSFAARAMEAGLMVRVLRKATTLDGQPVSRGSVLVHRNDNRGDRPNPRVPAKWPSACRTDATTRPTRWKFGSANKPRTMINCPCRPSTGTDPIGGCTRRVVPAATW